MYKLDQMIIFLLREEKAKRGRELAQNRRERENKKAIQCGMNMTVVRSAGFSGVKVEKKRWEQL